MESSARVTRLLKLQLIWLCLYFEISSRLLHVLRLSLGRVALPYSTSFGTHIYIYISWQQLYNKKFYIFKFTYQYILFIGNFEAHMLLLLPYKHPYLRQVVYRDCWHFWSLYPLLPYQLPWSVLSLWFSSYLLPIKLFLILILIL